MLIKPTGWYSQTIHTNLIIFSRNSQGFMCTSINIRNMQV